MRSGARVRLLTKEHVRITAIAKEDKGMYQCLIKNDIESMQATAEIRLGGKFIIFKPKLNSFLNN